MGGLNVLTKDKIFNVRLVALEVIELMNGIMFYNKDSSPHIYKEFIQIKEIFLKDKNEIIKTVIFLYLEILFH